jgi:hypothetical protein
VAAMLLPATLTASVVVRVRSEKIVCARNATARENWERKLWHELGKLVEVIRVNGQSLARNKV